MGLLYLIVSIAAAVAGFYIARTFVRRRLRFVDAVYSPARRSSPGPSRR
jgi:hypothetical protein